MTKLVSAAGAVVKARLGLTPSSMKVRKKRGKLQKDVGHTDIGALSLKPADRVGTRSPSTEREGDFSLMISI